MIHHLKYIIIFVNWKQGLVD